MYVATEKMIQIPNVMLTVMGCSPSSQSPPPAHRHRSSASPSPSTGSVQVVTRKVIRTLEGLGHAIEDVADDEHHEMEDETEVAAALRADKRQGKQRAQPEVKKIDWEIPRKVFHSSIGFITLGLYLTPSIAPRAVTVVLWSALAVIAPTDVVRLRVPAVERVYERLLGFLMRKSERTGTNGTLWYILGCNFALTFYPIDVATVSILIVLCCVLRIVCHPKIFISSFALLLPSALHFYCGFFAVGCIGRRASSGDVFAFHLSRVYVYAVFASPLGGLRLPLKGILASIYFRAECPSNVPDHAGIRPDIMLLGKALSGRVYPVSAVAGGQGRDAVHTAREHGSTYGG
ncbi:hypothetical protein B0H14DRAFT_2619320 [Mycena olivaceomarginata]|nr:hypothetical protein B0H14DRAFT_2619320 [Mycena olivaceomarginata]